VFTIGHYLLNEEEDLRVVCDDRELSRHVNRPWFRAYAEDRLGRVLSGDDASEPTGSAQVSESELARHACVCGSSGSGKTRLALRMLSEQLRAGCSVVMLDPKAQTVQHLLQLAQAAGVRPSSVTVLQPDALGIGAPGWNPLAGTGGVPPEQAAADIVSVLARSAPGSWGPRLQDLLTNALIVIAAHRLSLFELARFLQRDDYREGLLRLAPEDGMLADPEAYAEAVHFFAYEFSRWSSGERAGAVAPVVNKFRELLRSPFLRAVLCARHATFDLADLWRRQSVVAVHLDAAGLGDEGARLLGGLLAHQLYQTALRASGPVPVVLCLDEMGVAEGFIGDAAARILAMARSQNLRLLVACQHLAQLSDGLRAALFANTAIRAFFRLGYDDARLVAAWLAAGTGERVDIIRADAPAQNRGNGGRERASVAHEVCDGYGSPMALSEAAWTAFAGFCRGATGDRKLAALGHLAAVSGIKRLYVMAPDTGQAVELSRYVRGVGDGDYAFTGPAPVGLVISFPRPRLSVTVRRSEAERGQRWLRTLMELPVRHAVLRSATGLPGIVEVADVPDTEPSPELTEFLAKSGRSGQPATEVAAALEWRKAEVERVASLAGKQPASEIGLRHTLPSSKGGGSAIPSKSYSNSKRSEDNQRFQQPAEAPPTKAAMQPLAAPAESGSKPRLAPAKSDDSGIGEDGSLA